MADILEFNGITTLDLPVTKVIEQALSAGLTDVVIMGYIENGNEYFRSSNADGAEVLWLMERLKMKLLTVLE